MLLLSAQPALAVITRLTPLGEVLKEQQFICVAKVEKLDREGPTAVLVVSDDLKGKLPYRRLPVKLVGDSDAKELGHTPQLLKRLAPDLPVILFANQRGKRLTVFAYTNGTWFQMVGQQTREEGAALGFTHCEPYLRRTFKGATAELRQIIVDGLAGKKAPPEPNAKEPPGFGPEIHNPKSEVGNPKSEIRNPKSEIRNPTATGGHLFAVIPTLGIGGPLAILALLFPSLFGGVLVLFRRWTAFFTVISVVSLVYLLHGWLAKDIRGSYWSTTPGIWLIMTLVTALGVLWCLWRHIMYLQDPQRMEAPQRTETLVLVILSLSCLAAVGLYWLNLTEAADPTWDLLLVVSAGIWVGTLYKLWRAVAYRRGAAASALPIEAVILWTCLCGFVAFAAMSPGLPAALGQGDADSISSDFGPTSGGDQPALAKFRSVELAPLTSQAGSGLVVSSPRVVGDRVYVSVAHKAGLDTFGAVYCLDRNSRKVLWAKDDDGGMKQMFSSPWVEDGRLYVGEGFHDDKRCKLYCLDAATGNKLWDYQTDSQTESSPCVAGGKVFFGAGNDGVFALDAKSGSKLWQFPAAGGKKGLLRVGASPVVVGGRLYVGSGVDRNSPEDPGETAVFCLDADTGGLVWKVPVSLPAWGAPAVAGDRVYFGLGNGDVFTEADAPAGTMLCLDVKDGRKVWEVKVPGGVLEQPVVDRQNLYFGSRDGHCYCVNRYNGAEQWKASLGSPVIAAPALDHTSTSRYSGSVFVVAKSGRISCLDPATGKAFWTYHDLEKTGRAHLSSAPKVVVSSGPDGERRQIFVGAALESLSLPALCCLEDILPR
jgi:outer membrane protein assembly factor BamB